MVLLAGHSYLLCILGNANCHLQRKTIWMPFPRSTVSMNTQGAGAVGDDASSVTIFDLELLGQRTTYYFLS